MALIKCRECGKEISDQAEKCPNCGCPIGSNVTFDNNIPYQNTVYVRPYESKKKNSVLGILALVFSILGCTFIVGVILAIIDLCKKDGNKKTCSVIALVVCAFWLLVGIIGSATGGGDTNQESQQVVNVENESVSTSESSTTVNSSESQQDELQQEEKEEETKDKYYVGDTWENKSIKITYTDCYEFTDYNQYNAPADGYKIICAEFEFENIGNSDVTVMYTDYHGYADGYEVSQSYAPEGTGLDFTVKMSAGRKGVGKVAFEVPEDAKEIEIEFSPNLWTSENIIFVYQ